MNDQQADTDTGSAFELKVMIYALPNSMESVALCKWNLIVVLHKQFVMLVL